MAEDKKIDLYYALYVLTGSAFKTLFVLREITNKRMKKDPSCDRWIEISYEQLKQKTGIQSIFRCVEELKMYPELVEIDSMGSGTSNRYRLKKELLDTMA